MCGGEKKDYVLIKDFNTFMYDHTLYRGRKHFFFRYCVHAFVTEEILKCYIKGALRLMENKLLKCLKEVNMLNSIILKEK